LLKIYYPEAAAPIAPPTIEFSIKIAPSSTIRTTLASDIEEKDYKIFLFYGNLNL
jgi:hypothetical protein